MYDDYYHREHDYRPMEVDRDGYRSGDHEDSRSRAMVERERRGRDQSPDYRSRYSSQSRGDRRGGDRSDRKVAPYVPANKRSTSGTVGPMVGPLVPTPSFSMPLDRMEPEKVYEDLAEDFLKNELECLEGIKRVVGEGVRKIVRFDMVDQKIVSVVDHGIDIREDTVKGLGRIWQSKEGFLMVRHFMDFFHNDTKTQVVKALIFSINGSSYRKLSALEAREHVKIDDMWRKDKQMYHLTFE